MPSSSDELEDFKTSINLSQYAAAQGYVLDPKSSSRNSAVMANTAGDKIIIAKGHDQHWVYFSIHSASDPGGSIIDFVQHQGGGPGRCSLGHVRQTLRPWLTHTSSPSPLPPTAHPLSGHTHSSPPLSLDLPPEDTYARDLQPISRDLVQVRARLEDSIVIDGHHGYLCDQRKIPASLLGCDRFLGRVRSDANGNVIFPHWNEEGLCGYETKNLNHTGFSRGGIKGLWGSRKFESDRVLVIAETSIDALSYSALHGYQNTRFVSVAGQMSPAQLGLLGMAMKGMSAPGMLEGSEIIAAVDHDKGGEQIGEAIQGVYDEFGDLKGAGVCFRVHMPSESGEDWNDALRRRVAKSERLYGRGDDQTPGQSPEHG